MFGIVIMRNGTIHAISYRLTNGSYRSYCGKVLSRNLRMNTLSSSDTFDGMCRNCKSICDEVYRDELNHDLQMVRNSVQFKYYDTIEFQRLDIEGPKAQYEDLTVHHWAKLIKYQRLIQKSKKK
jgi:hypothetical protein